MEFSESHTPPDSPTHSNPLTNPPSRYLNLADPTNPYRLDHGDSPSITLVADLLTTENYTTWSHAMKRALRAKNKLGFIDDTLTKPSFPADPLIDLWNRCNDMVVSWIQNSITTSLKSSVAFVDDAYKIWMDLHERLSHQNGPRIFQLKKALASLSQEHDSETHWVHLCDAWGWKRSTEGRDWICYKCKVLGKRHCNKGCEAGHFMRVQRNEVSGEGGRIGLCRK
ncbi:hypothetical protein F2P56_023610 [Juglans regia]|uniref:Uncharacterized protein LOC108997591 isoform X1 n=2 Tax=Juglans regia TaxID=51240 RepID=A0A2I4FCW3_JUGRE|nr:uncharacterized protein LOC108997591 isoform X1 [Juglans regia]KAF5453898.1 hypothetical protein F2P56_023610 [Juglans regia]